MIETAERLDVCWLLPFFIKSDLSMDIKLRP